MANTHLPAFWAERTLGVVGAPRRKENVRFLHAWAVAEGGTAQWNPLNTTYKLPNSWDYNKTGVQNYKRATEGVCATGLTLVNGFYGRILGHLQAGTYTAEQIVEDCRDQIKTWGTNPDTILAALANV